MGWASGSGLLADVAMAIEDALLDTDLSTKAKIELYSQIIEAFEDRDCDTLDECVGISDELDEALRLKDYYVGYDDED